MTAHDYFQPDKNKDLVFERVIDVPRELVWNAWTDPKHVVKWFTPAPWRTVDCEIDLTPGGIFRTVMRSPEGQDFPNIGCYLEIVKNEKLIWTDMLQPGYSPSTNGFFTAVLTLEKLPQGTKYKVLARHKDEEARKKHEDMGFHDGWGKALDQLVELCKTTLKV
ncbi:polyketide cyclase [Leptospira fletcheri]|uniref:Polyketide cyclase n=1 Tax=Leptospira fletcheri TaxID=2484981 RepID=A0A4R9GJV1_9LEPT|nr:SRPBCC family protein [Leptospira fletcheri]TGK12393.1 polyketide cyclase [Leptospira fletcheri]